MASLPRVIDVEDAPDLLRLVEEVRDTHDEVVLRQGGEEIVVLVPANPRTEHRAAPVFTEEDIEAFRSAAGSWEGLIDPDEFIADIYERRKHWMRASVDL